MPDLSSAMCHVIVFLRIYPLRQYWNYGLPVVQPVADYFQCGPVDIHSEMVGIVPGLEPCE